MSVSLYIRFFILAVYTITTLGCGYHLTNFSSSAFGNAKTVWIPYFINESTSSTAQTVLRRAFYDEFYALRGIIPAANEVSSDLAVKARLISYLKQPVSYNAFDQVREFRLNLTLQLEITEKNNKKPLWKGELQVSTQYPANNNLALQNNSEEEAVNAAARIIAHKFISVIEENY